MGQKEAVHVSGATDRRRRGVSTPRLSFLSLVLGFFLVSSRAFCFGRATYSHIPLFFEYWSLNWYQIYAFSAVGFPLWVTVFVLLCLPAESLRCGPDGADCGALMSWFGVFYFLFCKYDYLMILPFAVKKKACSSFSLQKKNIGRERAHPLVKKLLVRVEMFFDPHFFNNVLQTASGQASPSSPTTLWEWKSPTLTTSDPRFSASRASSRTAATCCRG